MSPMQKYPRLERQSESLPRLGHTGRDSDVMSRRSGLGGLSNNLNQSMEMLKPLKNDSSMMKIAGNSIMGGIAKERMSTHTVDYGILRDDSRMS